MRSLDINVTSHAIEVGMHACNDILIIRKYSKPCAYLNLTASESALA